MRYHLQWLFLIIFGIALIGCQDDITINNPENPSNSMNKPAMGKQSSENLTIELTQIGDRIWKDLNKNGIQDAGEEGFSGITVALYTCDGGWLNIITETDANGKYLFKNLEPGNYKVAMNIPDGWLLSPKNRGNDRKDSDFGRTEVNPSYTDCFEINHGEIDLTWDGGLYPSKNIRPKDYGYWKTHSKYGPSKYDATWALIGEDTPFFYSEQTWIEVIKTSPRKRNTYYILAHQYIAARLNELSGSYLPTNIANAILKATELFDNSTNTPDYIGNLRRNNPLRKEFLELAELLDKYNRGKINQWHRWWN